MPDARAIIRITAAPDSALRKAIDGSVAAARRASKETASAEIKAAKDAEREKLRASKAAEKAAAQAAASAIKAAKAAEKAQVQAIREVHEANRQAAADAQKIARQQAREAEKLAREEVKWTEWAEKLKYQAIVKTARIAEREAAKQRREAAKTARQQVKEAQAASQRRRRIGTAVGGAAVGMGVAVAGRAQSYAGAFGARSREEMAAGAVNFKRRLAIVSDMGGLDAGGRDALQAKILSTSKRTGISADELLGGLSTAQDRFTDLKGFAAILDQVADVSVATETDVEAVVGAMGVMRRQFRLTDQEMQQLTGALVSAAELGNVSFRDVADNFASALGGLARNANLTGMGGAIQALAISQTMGASDKTPSEVASLITNVTTAFSNPKVRQTVAQSKADGGFGVRLSKNGALRSIPQIVKELSEAGFMRPENSARRYESFRDKEGREAIEVLVSQYESDRETGEKLLNMSPEAGSDMVKRRMGLVNEGVLGQAATIGSRQFATFMESGEFDRFMAVTVKSADELTQLGAKFPLMAEAADAATGALKGLAAALVGERLLGGAAGSAVGSAVGSAGGAAVLRGGLAVGAAGTGAMVAGGAAAGAAGYFGTKALMGEEGERAAMQFGINIWDAWDYRARSKTRGIEPYEPVPTQTLADLPQLTQPQQPAAFPYPGQSMAPDATLKIKIEGPGRVTSVSSEGFGTIETLTADTGRRDVFPP